MPLKNIRKAILCKVETVYGTDAAPVAATDALLVRNVSLNPIQLNLDGRAMVLPYFGNDGALVAGKFCAVSFEVEMAGSGAAGTAPKYDSALQGCALSSTNSPGVSQTYAPISSGEKSVTLYVYQDGILHKVLGAKGNVAFAMDAGR